MKVTFFGTGTSFGIPVINCNCACCKSKNPHDKRNRSSVKIEASDGTTVLVDIGPEFRLAALKYGLERLDSLFITHSHADHIHGLDDVRIFAHTFSDSKKNSSPLNVYANSSTNDDIRNRFDYVFKKTQFGGGKPALNLIDAESFSEKNPIRVGLFQVVPVPLLHGALKTCGWIFSESASAETENSASAETINPHPAETENPALAETKKSLRRIENAQSVRFAYLTDCSEIPPSSFELVKDCEYIVIDALREKEHSTHFSIEQAFEIATRTKAKHIYFIHMCHDITEKKMKILIKKLKAKYKILKDVKIQPSYDGQIIFCK